jgi:hypothetical protein
MDHTIKSREAIKEHHHHHLHGVVLVARHAVGDDGIIDEGIVGIL